MQGLDHFDDNDSHHTVFRDVIFLALAGFMAMVLLLLPHVNPPTTGESLDVTAPGSIIVEIEWPSHLDTDVDLWVLAPRDVPVGYSNKGSQIFNLLRDDLGHQADVSSINYEVAYSRGAPAGEYTVNLHLYRNQSGVLPIEVTVVISIKENADMGAKRILTTKVKLKNVGEELTVLRFGIDSNRKIIPGSVHDRFKKLRSQT